MFNKKYIHMNISRHIALRTEPTCDVVNISFGLTYTQITSHIMHIRLNLNIDNCGNASIEIKPKMVLRKD